MAPLYLPSRAGVSPGCPRPQHSPFPFPVPSTAGAGSGVATRGPVPHAGRGHSGAAWGLSQPRPPRPRTRRRATATHAVLARDAHAGGSGHTQDTQDTWGHKHGTYGDRAVTMQRHGTAPQEPQAHTHMHTRGGDTQAPSRRHPAAQQHAQHPAAAATTRGDRQQPAAGPQLLCMLGTFRGGGRATTAPRDRQQGRVRGVRPSVACSPGLRHPR